MIIILLLLVITVILFILLSDFYITFKMLFVLIFIFEYLKMGKGFYFFIFSFVIKKSEFLIKLINIFLLFFSIYDL